MNKLDRDGVRITRGVAPEVLVALVVVLGSLGLGWLGWWIYDIGLWPLRVWVPVILTGILIAMLGILVSGYLRLSAGISTVIVVVLLVGIAVTTLNLVGGIPSAE